MPIVDITYRSYTQNCLLLVVRPKELVSRGVRTQSLEWRKCKENVGENDGGPQRVLSGPPERGIIGLGCGVGLNLSGFDHIIASSTKKHTQKKQSGSEPPLSHYALHLSFRFSSPFLCKDLSPFFPPLPAFLSHSSSLICCPPPSPLHPLSGCLTKHTPTYTTLVLISSICSHMD